jgi:hypothetical protein
MKLRRLSSAAMALVVAAGAVAQSDQRGSFAYAAKIETSGSENAWQLTLPPHVHQNTASITLDDLRVVNAAGEVVPYALSAAAPASTGPAPQPVTLPLFALRGDAKLGVNGVRLRFVGDGTSIDVQGAGSGKATPQLLGYLLDARQLNRPIDELLLQWSGTEEFSVTLNVESSQDLVNWSHVTTGAIANLRYNDQSFQHQRIVIGGASAPYWRLTWPANAPVVTISRIDAVPVASAVAVSRSMAQSNATAVPAEPGEYRYELPGHLPVDRLNIRLPETNAVALAEVSSRASEQSDWRAVTSINLHRLTARSGGEIANGAVALSPNTDRYWRVRIQPAAAIRASTLTVESSWIPTTVQFIARGAGPYELLYGNVDAKLAATPLQTLLAGLQSGTTGTVLPQATLAAPVVVGGPARLQFTPPPVPLPWKQWILWATLVLGALLIGAMAFRMLREAPHSNE